MNDKLDADLPAQFVAGARKSSFVITDIVRSDEEPDDADNTLHADQLAASEVTESPRGTQTLDGNFSWVSSPVVADMSLNDTYSRFRIVKIESRDRWHRGRWTCHDFADPPERVKTGQTVENDSTASSVSKNGPSIYYIPSTQDALRSPFGIVYNTGGHPVLEANFLASPKYARGSRFFTGSFLSPDDVTEDRKGSAVTGMDLSSQRTSAADHQEQVGHSAARKLFPSDESNVFVPLEISVSECGRNDVEDTRTVSRQLSNILLTAVDAQRTAGQTSPLDVMMSVTLGPSSSEPDMRLAVVCLVLHSLFKQ